MNLALFISSILIACASQAYADPTFTLFWSKDKSAVVTEENALKLTENFPLKVIVHGFKAFTSSESEWMDTMKNAIFDATPSVYVIKVHWISGSLFGNQMPTYETDAKNTLNVGKKLGNIIKRIVRDPRTTNVHCIGHSLGSHICASASNNPGPIFSRISALDPAGPLFMDRETMNGLANRLDSTDATVVDVYHTNNGRGQVVDFWKVWEKNPLDLNFGYTGSLGHYDFIINDGVKQPACGLLSGPQCSHKMAPKYYIQSIIKGPGCFTGKQGAATITAGYFLSASVPLIRPGEYKVVTTSSEPYCSK